jgi:hypothetical protein
MIGLLEQILCWLKQLGAMFLNGLIGFVNLLIDAVDLFVQAAVDAWVLGWPTLPSVPSELVTVIGWIRWTPIPLEATLAFFAFWLVVQVAWLVIRPILYWSKFGVERGE